MQVFQAARADTEEENAPRLARKAGTHFLRSRQCVYLEFSFSARLVHRLSEERQAAPLNHLTLITPSKNKPSEIMIDEIRRTEV